MGNGGKRFYLFLSVILILAKETCAQYDQVETDTLFTPVNSDISSPVLEQEIATLKTGKINQDTLVIMTENLPDPIKAALLSAALPGLGQVYNKSYWKVPLVFGGLMSFGYLVHYFDYNYIKFRNAFLASRDANPNTINPYENDRRINNRLFDHIEFYRRNRDYLMILTTGFYLLNIMEAHVDAHLQSFDLSDDISLNIRPDIISTPFVNQFGLSVNITFK